MPERKENMDCKHDNSMLMGTADGIVCRGCGKLFKSFDEIHPKAESAPAEAVEPQDKPRKAAPRKKKEDKADA